MKRLAIALLLSLWTSLAAAQLPPAAGLVVDNTPVQGGTTGYCLYKKSDGRLGAQACSTGSVSTFSAGTTGFTPNSATSGAVTLAGVLVGANGGTGVANTGKTITLGGSFATSGAFDTTLTVTAATNVTLPTTGTLAVLGANAFTGVQTINLNAAAAPALANSSLQAVQADTTQNLITMDAFAQNAQLVVRRANNTAASPSALANADLMGGIQGRGYRATGYSTAAAAILFQATEGWTDSANGARAIMYATPTGSTTLTGIFTVEGGGVIVTSGKTLQLGNTFAAGAPAATGYVTIVDAAGNTYKLLAAP